MRRQFRLSRDLQAAENGCKHSQYELGVAYGSGKEVKRDEEKAAFWLRKAAKQGHPGAQYRIGDYLIGKFEYKQAAKWHLRAAKQGHGLAADTISVMYEHGLGVEQNSKRAAEWLCVAAINGSRRALEKVIDKDYLPYLPKKIT